MGDNKYMNIKIQKVFFIDKQLKNKTDEQHIDSMTLKLQNQKQASEIKLQEIVNNLKNLNEDQKESRQSMFNNQKQFDLFKQMYQIEIVFTQNNKSLQTTTIPLPLDFKLQIKEYVQKYYKNPCLRLQQEQKKAEINEIGFGFMLSDEVTYYELYNPKPYHKRNSLAKEQKIQFEYFEYSEFWSFYIKVTSQFTMRVLFNKEHIKSIKRGKKSLYYIELSSVPDFYGQITDSRIYTNPSRIQFWHKIQNFIMLDSTDSTIRHYFKHSTVRKSFTVKLQAQGKITQFFKEFMKNQVVQNIQNNMNVSSYQADKFFLNNFDKIKFSNAGKQQLQEIKLKMHEIRLDYLLAIQNSNQKILEKMKKIWIQALSPEQIIQQIYEYIHIDQSYAKKRKSTKKQGKIKTNDDVVKIYNVNITPCGIIPKCYSNQLRNRVFREFDPRYFIRVGFCENNGERIYAASKHHDSNFIIKKALRKFLNGFYLCGFFYAPLGWSNSQIKKGQMWYILCDQRINPNKKLQVMQFLGDFSIIRQPSKKGVRIGQAFSASKNYSKALEIKSKTIDEIQAQIIKKVILSYDFSDGVGLISRDLLYDIISELKLTTNPEQICAIQFRYLGYKGVLSLGVMNQSNTIYLRNSLKKYECDNELNKKYFDILNWNKYCPGYINYEIILLLKSLKIPNFDEIIIRKAQKYLQEVYRLKYKNVQTIISFFKTHLDYSPINEDPMFEIIIFLLKKYPFILEEQNFFYQMITRVKAQSSIKMKAKFRMKIDKSARLMGILDTYDILEENQIFCQIQKQNSLIQNINTKAFLTKNPCMHPADIRAVRCISNEQISKRLALRNFDQKQFQKYVNCIVFPQRSKTSYPLSAQISGGDLDGDYYLICWDEELYPVRAQTYPPNLYDPGKIVNDKSQKKEDLTEEIQQKEVWDFFIQHLRKNNLTKVTSFHKTLANFLGADHQYCRQLAYIHSKSLDFSKKGQYQEIPQYIEKKFKELQSKHPHGIMNKLENLVASEFQKFKFTYSKQDQYVQRIYGRQKQWFHYLSFHDNFTNQEIDEETNVILDYKQEIETILNEKNKLWSSEFIFYLGRDEQFVPDALAIRRRFQNIFFSDLAEEDEILYQSLTFSSLNKQAPQFSQKALRKAYLWYLISNFMTIDRNQNHFKNQAYYSINDRIKQKLKSDYSRFKFKQINKSNIIGITWHVIPKIILTMIKQVCEKQNLKGIILSDISKAIAQKNIIHDQTDFNQYDLEFEEQRQQEANSYEIVSQLQDSELMIEDEQQQYFELDQKVESPEKESTNEIQQQQAALNLNTKLEQKGTIIKIWEKEPESKQKCQESSQYNVEYNSQQEQNYYQDESEFNETKKGEQPNVEKVQSTELKVQSLEGKVQSQKESSNLANQQRNTQS